MSFRVSVSNLAEQTTEATVRAAFVAAGITPESVQILSANGMAMVEVDTPLAADNAHAALDGKVLDGRSIRVVVPQDRSQANHQGRDGGGAMPGHSSGRGSGRGGGGPNHWPGH